MVWAPFQDFGAPMDPRAALVYDENTQNSGFLWGQGQGQV